MLDVNTLSAEGSDSSESDWKYGSDEVFSDEEASGEELGEVEGEDSTCLTDMVVNQILSIQNFIDRVSINLSCKECLQKEIHSFIHYFL